jgi:hypothetical protein
MSGPRKRRIGGRKARLDLEEKARSSHIMPGERLWQTGFAY